MNIKEIIKKIEKRLKQDYNKKDDLDLVFKIGVDGNNKQYKVVEIFRKQ